MWIERAYAAAQAAGRSMGDQFGQLFSFLPLVAIFGVFYFLLLRPQQKQRKALQEMLANVKTGDSVITRGGIEARVDKVEEKRLRIEVGNGIKMWMSRDYVDRIDTK